MEEIAGNFIHDIIDADLAERPETKIHTRFPPEPNGYLHIGRAEYKILRSTAPLYTAGKGSHRRTSLQP